MFLDNSWRALASWLGLIIKRFLYTCLIWQKENVWLLLVCVSFEGVDAPLQLNIRPHKLKFILVNFVSCPMFIRVGSDITRTLADNLLSAIVYVIFVPTFLLRVWSWLRMNAGGVDKACKSDDFLFWGRCDYIKLTDILEIVANELVTPWYVPKSLV